jgi:hypothetical protein
MNHTPSKRRLRRGLATVMPALAFGKLLGESILPI